MIKITVFRDKIPFGEVKISKNSNFDSIFRQILDFCYAKSSYCSIPEDLTIKCDNARLKEIILDGLNSIFKDVECDNEFIDFYKNRSIVANMENIP